MEIRPGTPKKSTKTILYLLSGEPFSMPGRRCCVRIHNNPNYNAVDVETGALLSIPQQQPITPISAYVQIEND